METEELKKEELTIKCECCGYNIRLDSKTCVFCGRPIKLFEPEKPKILTIKK